MGAHARGVLAIETEQMELVHSASPFLAPHTPYGSDVRKKKAWSFALSPPLGTAALYEARLAL